MTQQDDHLANGSNGSWENRYELGADRLGVPYGVPGLRLVRPRTPFSWKAENEVESVYQAISVMLAYHTSRGATRFVIPLTLEMASCLAHNHNYLDRFGLPLFHFRLTCAEDILRKRVLKRDRDPGQKTKELSAIPAQLHASEALVGAFTSIDVSVMNERAVAQKIMALVGGDTRGT